MNEVLNEVYDNNLTSNVDEVIVSSIIEENSVTNNVQENIVSPNVSEDTITAQAMQVISGKDGKDYFVQPAEPNTTQNTWVWLKTGEVNGQPGILDIIVEDGT